MSSAETPGGLIAVIGKRERLREALSAELAGRREYAVWDEKVRFYPGLRIRDNVRQLRMALPEPAQAGFESLLELSGLKKQGWSRPFRKDMTGQKRLFGLLEAMLTYPEALLVYDLLAGMEAKQREAFAKMADSYRESGGILIYTAQSLKDVMRLEIQQEIWLPGENGFRKTDTEAVSAKCVEAPEDSDALYQRMEAGEAW